MLSLAAHRGLICQTGNRNGSVAYRAEPCRCWQTPPTVSHSAQLPCFLCNLRFHCWMEITFLSIDALTSAYLSVVPHRKESSVHHLYWPYSTSGYEGLCFYCILSSDFHNPPKKYGLSHPISPTTPSPRSSICRRLSFEMNPSRKLKPSKKKKLT